MFGPAKVFDVFVTTELIPDVRVAVLVEYVTVDVGKLAVPLLLKKVLVTP
jgi:hypothetical protein